MDYEKNKITTTTLEPFSLTRKSRYLRCILDPMDSICPIPDEVNQKCIPKSETITLSVSPKPNAKSSTTGDGIFVFVLSSPSYIVGAHYYYDSDKARYIFDTYITVAQDLSQSYTDARAIAGGVDIISNTVSGLTFGVSGNFNAVTVDGPISQIGFNPDTQSKDRFFETILSATNNLMDKIGMVLVAEGVRLIALPPAFNIPFTRLRDAFPVQSSTGFGSTGTRNEVVDNSRELVYLFGQQNVTPPGSTIGTGGFDRLIVDSFEGPVTIDLTYDFAYGQQAPNWGERQVVFSVQLLSPFGDVLETLQANTESFNRGTLSASITADFDEPLGGVRVEMTQCITDDKETAMDGVAKYTIFVRCPNGNTPGINFPVSVVAYTNVNTLQSFNVSGVKSYELIPDVNLKKNLPTLYHFEDSGEMDFAKNVLARREELKIRSVGPISWFKENQSRLLEMGILDSNVIAESMDLGDIIGGIKSVAAPILSSFFPGMAPVINAGSTMLSNLFPNASSASGYNFSSADAADLEQGADFQFSNEVCDTEKPSPLFSSADMSEYEIIGRSSIPDPFNPTIFRHIPENSLMPADKVVEAKVFTLKGDLSVPLVVTFPVIMMMGPTAGKSALYGLTAGYQPKLLSRQAATKKTICPGGYTIYGYAGCRTVLPTLHCDMTMFQVLEQNQQSVVVPTDYPPVDGSSSQGAMVMLRTLMVELGIETGIKQGKIKRMGDSSLPFKIHPGVYGPITGAVKGEFLQPNFMYVTKSSYCRAIGINLIGSLNDQIPLRAAYVRLLSANECAPRGEPLKTSPLSVSHCEEWTSAKSMDGADLMTQLAALMDAKLNPLIERVGALETRPAPQITANMRMLNMNEEQQGEETEDEEEGQSMTATSEQDGRDPSAAFEDARESFAETVSFKPQRESRSKSKTPKIKSALKSVDVTKGYVGASAKTKIRIDNVDYDIPVNVLRAIKTAMVDNGYREREVLRSLTNLTTVKAKKRGMTTNEAQLAKAQKLAIDTGCDVNWILSNGLSGPTNDQRAYLRAVGHLPPGSKTLEGRMFIPNGGTLPVPNKPIPRSKSASKRAPLLDKLDTLIKSQSTNIDFVEGNGAQIMQDFVARNGSLPDAAQMAQLSKQWKGASKSGGKLSMKSGPVTLKSLGSARSKLQQSQQAAAENASLFIE